MDTFTYSSTQLYEGNKVRIAWDAEQEYDYNHQRISQYERALGIVDGCERVSSITNSVARKCQGTYEVAKHIVDGMTIGGHLAYGLGYSMTRANLLQLRQEIENQSIIRGYYTPGSGKTTEKKAVSSEEKAISSEKITSSSEKKERVNQTILAAVKKNPKVSAAEIAMLLGLSFRAVEKRIKALRENGILRRIGPDKGGLWEIIEK